MNHDRFAELVHQLAPVGNLPGFSDIDMLDLYAALLTVALSESCHGAEEIAATADKLMARVASEAVGLKEQ